MTKLISKMTIGKAAAAAGVNVETIRFYEREGLIAIPPKPYAGGFRDYPEETVRRICFIRHAQELGFNLREAKELLSLRVDPSKDCSDIRARARTKRQEIDEKISRLTRMNDALDKLIHACPGQGQLPECPILEALDDGVSKEVSSSHP